MAKRRRSRRPNTNKVRQRRRRAFKVRCSGKVFMCRLKGKKLDCKLVGKAKKHRRKHRR